MHESPLQIRCRGFVETREWKEIKRQFSFIFSLECEVATVAALQHTLGSIEKCKYARYFSFVSCIKICVYGMKCVDGVLLFSLHFSFLHSMRSIFRGNSKLVFQLATFLLIFSPALSLSLVVYSKNVFLLIYFKWCEHNLEHLVSDRGMPIHRYTNFSRATHEKLVQILTKQELVRVTERKRKTMPNR